jgi:ERCC4-type nuclease
MNFLIDHREDSLNYQRAQQLKNICEAYITKHIDKFNKDTEVIIQQNLVGDIVYGNTCIELKADAIDLVSSFRSNRMAVQIDNMVANYTHNYLIYIGTNDEIRSACKSKPKHLMKKGERQLNPAMIFGGLASFEARKNIHVKKYATIELAMEDMLPIMVKANDGKESSIEINPQRLASTKSDKKLRVLTSYSMVGTDKAKDILEKFGSIKNFVNATKDELKEVNKIGNKIADEIIEINN